ncbi:MAG: hypothetical protein ACOX52_24530 [Verrucomicrobiota bacterium]|jgi:hypothetical protein
MDPTHPHGQVENATAPSAPSAGGSPDPDGKVGLGRRSAKALDGGFSWWLFLGTIDQASREIR